MVSHVIYIYLGREYYIHSGGYNVEVNEPLGVNLTPQCYNARFHLSFPRFFFLFFSISPLHSLWLCCHCLPPAFTSSSWLNIVVCQQSKLLSSRKRCHIIFFMHIHTYIFRDTLFHTLYICKKYMYKYSSAQTP